MKLYIAAASLLLWSNCISSQCLFPSDNSGISCENATFLCPIDLLSLRDTLFAQNNPDIQSPVCPNDGEASNVRWYKFFACEETVELQITPANCSLVDCDGITVSGLQAGLFRECGFSSPIACSGQGLVDSFSLVGNDLEVGELIYLFLDGYKGSICEYEINAISGIDTTTVEPSTDPSGMPKDGMVVGMIDTCQGTYSVIPPTCISEGRIPRCLTQSFSDQEFVCYEWIIDPPTGFEFVGDSTAAEVVINWLVTDTFEINVIIHQDPILNSCSSGTKICGKILPLTVISTEPIIDILPPIVLCEGESIEYCGEVVTEDSSIRCKIDSCHYEIQRFIFRGTLNADIDFNQDRLCEEGILSLMATGDQDLVSFLWGDGQSTSVIDINVSQAGNFVVTVTDNCGFSAVANQMISADLFQTPDHAVSLIDSRVSCTQGQPAITLTAAISGVPSAFQDAIEIEWNTGIINSNSISVEEQGIYSVTVTVCDSIRTASIDIMNMLDVEPPNVDITAEELRSDNCSIRLTANAVTTVAGEEIIRYAWSTNESDRSINAESPGTYTVEVTDLCGSTAEQSIVLTEEDFNVGLPEVSIITAGLNPTFCGLILNAETTLSNGAFVRSILWTPVAEDSITVTEPGLYSVTVTDNCNRTNMAQIMINESDLDFPDPTFEGTNGITSSLNQDCDQVLIANPQPGADGLAINLFEWNTGQSGQSIVFAEPGIYSVTATDNCGNFAVDSIEVFENMLDFPNIFFPDSQSSEDGFQDNNSFGPYVESCPELFDDYNLQIFNRWGKQVFETTFVEQRWSGSLNNQGERLEEEVYFWQATYNGITNHGNVTLVRNN